MLGDDVTIRPSRDEDVAAIAAIYAHHVLHGVASFEEVPPPAEEIARRRRAIIERGLPYLVAERSGRVVGYCYAGPFRPRIGYRFTLEDSVYVDANEVGRGIGRRLLEQVIARCTELGYRQMVAVIGGRETVPSIKLHERCGFAHIGVLPAVGFKFGRWIDIVMMQRALGPGAASMPQELRGLRG
ncbi:MAG TPA: GNAT family N-acetyltransferase [Stellaceae bacterium]|jgi:phosphinothricin acetyltransferase|nr:GNAT family N-acetyltransferase [Stellaceae bacterium]